MLSLMAIDVSLGWLFYMGNVRITVYTQCNIYYTESYDRLIRVPEYLTNGTRPILLVMSPTYIKNIPKS